MARISVELIIAALIAASFSAWGFFVLSRLTERVIANLREDMVGTALGLPVHRVEDAGTGDLVSRSTDDVAELSKAVTETVPILANSGFAIVTTALALVTLDWQSPLSVVASDPDLYHRRAQISAWQLLAVMQLERAPMADRARRVLKLVAGAARCAHLAWKSPCTSAFTRHRGTSSSTDILRAAPCSCCNCG